MRWGKVYPSSAREIPQDQGHPHLVGHNFLMGPSLVVRNAEIESSSAYCVVQSLSHSESL